MKLKRRPDHPGPIVHDVKTHPPLFGWLGRKANPVVFDGDNEAALTSYLAPLPTASLTLDPSPLPGTALTPGRHILYVRGRGVNDYAGFHSWGPVSATFLDVLSPSLTPTPASTATTTLTLKLLNMELPHRLCVWVEIFIP